jgi:subtilisin family serine protease
MIVTANKYVNARVGRPFTDAPNPSYLRPGDQVNVTARILGENLEGCNEWFLTDNNEFLTQLGFLLTPEIADLPYDNVPLLFTQLEISKLWSISKGEGIKIGIIDNGVAENHPALGNRVKELNTNPPFETSLENHGTTMACIIAAKEIQSGKIGISPMIENIFSYSINIETIDPAELVIALDLMFKQKVNILNLSFCSNRDLFFHPAPEAIALQSKIDELTNSGCIIICATGNNHRRNLDFYPAKYKNVISVAGYDMSGEVDFDSNIWNGISISMASEQHYFSDSQQFEHSNGTSSATAIISGCIACVYNKIRGAPKSQIINNIFSKLSKIKMEFNQGEITIPKFDTNTFLQQINL